MCREEYTTGMLLVRGANRTHILNNVLEPASASRTGRTVNMTIEKDVPLAPYTTFGIGGPARFFVRVKTIEELQESLDFARDKGVDTLTLGGGSNMLVDDAGFDGLVIKMELRGIEVSYSPGAATVVAAAGESWDALVAFAVEKNLWGIENLSGIPGTVGAAPVQNIGAYGSELRDTLVWVRVYDTHTQTTHHIEAPECGFGYRTSMFKEAPGRYIILHVALRLALEASPKITYADLAKAFSGATPSLGDIRRAVLAIRAQKFPDLSQEGTAGSFFLNPIVSSEIAEQLGKQHPELPRYAAGGQVKVSLAWLLDKGLNLRGYAVGGARLFEKQPLVLVAARGASSKEVVALAQEVIHTVRDAYAIEIQPEVRIIQNKIK